MPLPKVIIMFNRRIKFGTGCKRDPVNIKDRLYDGIAFGAAPFDWVKGYDIEEIIKHKLFFQDQDGSSSCVGQAWAYYVAVLNTLEINDYISSSAKGFYSQIFLPSGGAYIRDGGKLTVNWGAVPADVVPSYDNKKPPTEVFMRNLDWKTVAMDNVAKSLKAKEYRMIANVTMEIVAQGIRDNYGVVGGLEGANNGSWSTLEPKPGKKEWGHALYFGKAGIDDKGKYIATPNSWGDRFKGKWQKLREEWFTNEYMFNPWLLVDQPNFSTKVIDFMHKMDKGMIIENEPPGRKGIIYDKKLMEVINGREGVAALYLIENKTSIRRVSKDIFNMLPKGNNF